VVVAISEAAAAVVAVGGFLVLRSAALGTSALQPVLTLLYFMVGVAVVALVGSWTALRFRSPRRRLALDILTTLGLLGLMVLVHVKTIILAPLP
jgi:NADH:ubiquinone oxidoreductase subunit 5 (subunit L)/multisubunit Na+/H+ antiporter MnhA subunit